MSIRPLSLPDFLPPSTLPLPLFPFLKSLSMSLSIFLTMGGAPPDRNQSLKHFVSQREFHMHQGCLTNHTWQEMLVMICKYSKLSVALWQLTDTALANC
jgi:hypothetical protein